MTIDINYQFNISESMTNISVELFFLKFRLFKSIVYKNKFTTENVCEWTEHKYPLFTTTKEREMALRNDSMPYICSIHIHSLHASQETFIF